MMKKKKIVLIIPAYNEAANLPQIAASLIKVRSQLSQEGYLCELVVIDDGSADQTAQVAANLGATVISHPYNLGVCAALHTGFLFAKEADADLAVTFDADGQHNPEDVRTLLRHHLATGEDVVIGSRFVADSGYRKNIARYMGIQLFSIVVKLLTKKKIYDITSGFRLFTRPVIHYLAEDFPQNYPDAEILISLIKSGFSIVEIPIPMQQRLSGQSQHSLFRSIIYPFKNLIAILIVLIRLYVSKRRNYHEL